MSAITIDPGGLVTKDPSAEKVYQFNWTDYLTDLGSTIATTSFTITGPDAILTKDSEGIISGNLKTQLRLAAGTTGGVYQVTNRMTDNATPANTDERSFFVLVENR